MPGSGGGDRLLAGMTVRIADGLGPDDVAAATLAAGTVLGRYRIVELIGRGGMGVVYLAEHADLGTRRALKTLAPEWANHPVARARFLREARAAARINHPHVVRIFDCGSDDDRIPFFVMEYLDGEDLDAALSRTTLTIEQTAGIMLAVCAAISEMHDAGLIHRDLKPGNLFLARDRIGNIVPTVLDFGIVKSFGPGPSAARGQTQDGFVVGTPHYFSPEQLADNPADERSDQYALGIILYQCAVGSRPFEGTSATDIFRRIASFQFLTPGQARPEIPAAFDSVILTAMSERPENRFPSVFHLGKALLPFASAKHQTHWADFYARPNPSKSVLTMPIPVAASSAWLVRPQDNQASQTPERLPTQILSHAGGTDILPLSETTTMPAPLPAAASRFGSGSSGDHAPRIGDKVPTLVPNRAGRGATRQRSTYLLLGLGGAVAVIAATGLLFVGRSPLQFQPANHPRSAARSVSPSENSPAPIAPTIHREVEGTELAQPTAPPPVDRSPPDNANVAKITRPTEQKRPEGSGPVRSPGRRGKHVSHRRESIDIRNAGTDAPSTNKTESKYPAIGDFGESKYPAVQ